MNLEITDRVALLAAQPRDRLRGSSRIGVGSCVPWFFARAMKDAAKRTMGKRAQVLRRVVIHHWGDAASRRWLGAGVS